MQGSPVRGDGSSLSASPCSSVGGGCTAAAILFLVTPTASYITVCRSGRYWAREQHAPDHARAFPDQNLKTARPTPLLAAVTTAILSPSAKSMIRSLGALFFALLLRRALGRVDERRDAIEDPPLRLHPVPEERFREHQLPGEPQRARLEEREIERARVGRWRRWNRTAAPRRRAAQSTRSCAWSRRPRRSRRSRAPSPSRPADGGDRRGRPRRAARASGKSPHDRWSRRAGRR